MRGDRNGDEEPGPLGRPRPHTPHRSLSFQDYRLIASYVCCDPAQRTDGEASVAGQRLQTDVEFATALYVVEEALTIARTPEFDYAARRRSFIERLASHRFGAILGEHEKRPAQSWGRRLLSSRVWRATDDSLSWVERLGAAVLVLALITGAAYRLMTPWRSSIGSVHFAASVDERRTFELPDSVRVTLEPGSTIDYRSSKNRPSRVARLEGAAQLEVGHDSGRQFEARVDGLTARTDAGAFVVGKMSAPDRVTITVLRGNVDVWSDSVSTGPPKRLTAGQSENMSHGDPER